MERLPSLLALKETNEDDLLSPLWFHKTSGSICRTDTPAPAAAGRPDPLVVGADKFIPLWEKDLEMNWRFDEAALSVFQQPDRIKNKVRDLLDKALNAWGDATPIKFTENEEQVDFEFVVQNENNCFPGRGCTAARAFMPDAGRHEFYIYPALFKQTEKEQVDTLTHEIGHIFGLRHFFAPQTELKWPTAIFGDHTPFSIMNYGVDSEVTDTDRRDLKMLYTSVWRGDLTSLNGKPFKLLRPYHYIVP